ncbi:hypothetical protein RHGRI_034947 [Rhododendron griersonianum]|uniref:Uncharacterized protein n=1 Tax=Rhododendron griersonianum TaxID=479676 RepID=A0AAV6I2Q7_9ERIC|nr:hypothetical protein RHGRI_034947 [Rhododendron griersonianum]
MLRGGAERTPATECGGNENSPLEPVEHRSSTLETGEIVFRDLIGKSTAVIFTSLCVDDENRSYSSMTLARSSSQVIETNTSRSSLGNLHFKRIGRKTKRENDERTFERDRTVDCEDSGEAADVTELAVGGTGEDFAAVAVEELDCFGGVAV